MQIWDKIFAPPSSSQWGLTAVILEMFFLLFKKKKSIRLKCDDSSVSSYSSRFLLLLLRVISNCEILYHDIKVLEICLHN